MKELTDFIRGGYLDRAIAAMTQESVDRAKIRFKERMEKVEAIAKKVNRRSKWYSKTGTFHGP